MTLRAIVVTSALFALASGAPAIAENTDAGKTDMGAAGLIVYLAQCNRGAFPQRDIAALEDYLRARRQEVAPRIAAIMGQLDAEAAKLGRETAIREFCTSMQPAEI